MSRLMPKKQQYSPGATLTSKGQLTLPKAIRDLLRLAAGDRVDFIVKDDGSVVLRPATVDVRELNGLLHRKGIKPLSVDKMNVIIPRRGAGRA
jgi:AbrB family looped-hinge helix DNA binding protein